MGAEGDNEGAGQGLSACARGAKGACERVRLWKDLRHKRWHRVTKLEGEDVCKDETTWERFGAEHLQVQRPVHLATLTAVRAVLSSLAMCTRRMLQ